MTDWAKKPLGASLNLVARKRAQQAIQLTGRALPCTVKRVVQSGIVQVNFEVNAAPFTLPQVIVPVLGSEYVRLPLQPGARGMVLAADARLGQMSGLGGGTPDLTQPGNLTALVFVPIGSTLWPPLPDGDAPYTVIYGEDGVLIQTKPATPAAVPTKYMILGPGGVILKNGPMLVSLDNSTNLLTISHGAFAITFDGGSISITGQLIINGVPYLNHVHSGVTVGGSNTGAVF